MKIGGIDPKLLPPEQVLVLPRGDSEIVLKARGLPDMDEFSKFCPDPKPPVMLTRQGQKANLNDVGYQQREAEQAKRRWAYIVVKSLEPSQIEWDTVKLDDPATWANWDADLKAAGFTATERNRVFALCLEANSLDERKIQRAREVFLAGRPEAPSDSTSLSTAPPTTPSGAPASA